VRSWKGSSETLLVGGEDHERSIFLPTSDPAFFVDENGYLHHHVVGRLNLTAAEYARYRGAEPIGVYAGAPALAFSDIHRPAVSTAERWAIGLNVPASAARRSVDDAAKVFETATTFASTFSTWLSVAQFGAQFIDFVTDATDGIKESLSRIE
jgi:hypothetical protein